jgi:phage protein D
VTEISYELKIGGQTASPELLSSIVTLEVEDHADIADMLRLRVGIAVQEDGRAWTHVDDGGFDRLARMQIAAKVGDGQAEPLIDAYVVDVRAVMSNEPGHSTLDVVAMDATVLMNLEEKVKAWPDMSDSAIAQSIFGDHGLTPDVDDTQPTRQETDHTTMQRGTDMQFLRQLARRNGFECYVEADASGNSVGHFHKPRLDENPQDTLNVNLGMETNVDSFSARYDMLKPAQAKAASIDVSTQDSQPAESTSAEQTALGASSTVPADKPRVVLLSSTGLAQTGELQTLAQAEVDRSSFAIVAEGELHGATYGSVLKAKKPVNVRGAGTQFSGTYYVERVLHSFSGDGHVQRFRLRRNAGGVKGNERFQDDNSVQPQQATRVP